jgi:hypothetical protein
MIVSAKLSLRLISSVPSEVAEATRKLGERIRLARIRRPMRCAAGAHLNPAHGRCCKLSLARGTGGMGQRYGKLLRFRFLFLS